MFWNIVRSSKMANKTNFNESFEDHCINLIIYEHDVHHLHWIIFVWIHCWAHGLILNWWVNLDIKAIQLNHSFCTPYSQLTIKWCWDKLCRWLLLLFRWYWCQRCYPSWMSFEYMYWFLAIVFSCLNQSLIFMIIIKLNVFRF